MSIEIKRLILGFLKFQATMHVIHFQTQSYHVHIATDKLLKQFRKSFDFFVETYLGTLGVKQQQLEKFRATQFNDSIHIQSCRTVDEIVEFCNAHLTTWSAMINKKQGLPKQVKPILEDIMAHVSQYIYLVSFPES